MIVHSGIKDYKVITEPDLSFLHGLLQMPFTAIVADERVFHLYQKYFQDVMPERLILIKASEENKIVNTALSICEKMTEIPAKRNVQLISIGGGIIQDITGFAANILYRGIRWVFVPTTLLAGCDSCIGGKTSLNYKNYKNLLGTFYPPDEVHICPAFFQTLSQKDYESGLGEVVKFNMMAGKSGLEQIEHAVGRLLEKDESVIKQFVENSLYFKKEIIEADEFDKGERIKLNFAHTFGHAIESVTKYEIPHGTAVAVGMIMANYLSVKRGMLLQETCERMEHILLKIIHVHLRLTDYPLELFLEAIRKDKKQVGECLTAVLMTETAMGLEIVHDIQENEVADALRYFQEHYDAR
ncbi:MAG: hypothetical protein K2N87_02340 [Eubacterium sp.]|nr:hypothetical protein [Eubacterium sp.]